MVLDALVHTAGATERRQLGVTLFTRRAQRRRSGRGVFYLFFAAVAAFFFLLRSLRDFIFFFPANAA
jgi:hypothetical protein